MWQIKQMVNIRKLLSCIIPKRQNTYTLMVVEIQMSVWEVI